MSSYYHQRRESRTINGSIKKIFRDVFNGHPNILTPNILSYGRRGQFIYEISEGRGIDNETIYGITVLTADGRKTRLSKCVSNRGEIARHLQTLTETTLTEGIEE